jgi:hypothetical protein
LAGDRRPGRPRSGATSGRVEPVTGGPGAARPPRVLRSMWTLVDRDAAGLLAAHAVTPQHQHAGLGR